jgi:hypothetical protein
MASLYLGKIGGGKGLYEIHALTKDLPFREFPLSQIADAVLYDRMLEGRFRVLEDERPIYCTAIHPDPARRREYNPHDDRPGTVHIVALNVKTDEISCCISVAVDTGDRDSGTSVGLPLENRWKRNGYPEGASLDSFRERYVRLNHQSAGEMEPWRMAELYRHFKLEKNGGSLACRLGMYTGAYHLLVREARRSSNTPTTVWVFDAIPQYFHLYRLAGAAMLRALTIEHPPRYLSPGKEHVEERTLRGSKVLRYRGADISRCVPVPIPHMNGGGLEFTMDDVAFLDGVVDIIKVEDAVRTSPASLSPLQFQGMEAQDMDMLRAGLSVVGKRGIEDYHSPGSAAARRYEALRSMLVEEWDFNRIGS